MSVVRFLFLLRRFFIGLIIGFIGLGLHGCALFVKAEGPMQTRLHSNPHIHTPQGSKKVLVLLPGRGDKFGVFDQHRFVGFVQQETDFDVLEVDARLAYYLDRSIVDRMRAEVLQPLKDRGYREIWLAGVSLGGMGSIFTAQEHAPDITGVVLLSPYLGEPAIFNQIRRAGGLRHWQPGAIGGEDYQKRIWAWLKERVEQNDLPLWLAYGDKDYMAEGHRLLAAALPADRVLRDGGAHNWKTWASLWPGLVQAAWNEPAWSVPERPGPYALDKIRPVPPGSGDYVQR